MGQISNCFKDGEAVNVYTYKEIDTDMIEEMYEVEAGDSQKIDDLENKLLVREVADQAEEIMRLTHPAVQDAWEKYQITLKLARK